MSDPAALSHCATAHVMAEADAAFRFMADPIALGGWSLGCMRTRPDGDDGLHTGESLFDGGRGWFRIQADPERLTVDYGLGTPQALAWRIAAQVVRPERCALPAGTCYVSLIAWRPAGMADERWRRLCSAHETEILLIKAQIESGYRPD
ncbi:hypothetical protein [uncultured Alsobacter sp.]|uniref:hypothetical protein n=1 Tax=uncultured Alsobacter sp. TaxID=1748258 RepID=UPI0025E6DF32|nr:hypothetical protein [uncultured Alsobacter sp.]